jgi:hypothetical protein
MSELSERSDEAQESVEPGPLAGMSRPARLILGWGLLVAFVVLFASRALV